MKTALLNSYRASHPAAAIVNNSSLVVYPLSGMVVNQGLENIVQVTANSE